jgi:hypothetical protein
MKPLLQGQKAPCFLNFSSKIGEPMPLFKIVNDKLTPMIKEPFSLEKEVQTLTENSLKELFNLELIRSEFPLKNLRIDTLAFDNDTNAFVIIEYKKDKNFSVIDQGYAYLSMMLNNKADFILEYNENMKTTLKRKKVDWSQSKVVFVSPQFTTFQKQSINFRDLPIELWEIKRFSGDIVLYNRIVSEAAVESIKTVSKKEKEISGVTKEIKVYEEVDLLKSLSENIKEAYFKIKDIIYELDSGLEKKITKTMLCYRDNKGLIWINPKKNQIIIHLRKGKYKDKYMKIKYKGTFGGYPTLILKENDIDYDYLKDIFQQAYDN